MVASFQRVSPVLPVSVVVPTRDRPGLLQQLVDSILAGDAVPAEIVIADQSVDPAPVRSSNGAVVIEHLHLTQVGASHGRNAAIAAARHDILAFTDDDIVVEPDWLARLVAALDDAPPGSAVTGAVRSGATVGKAPSTTRRTRFEVFSGRPGQDPLCTGNMAIRRSAIEEIGAFDERLGGGAPFPAAEDNDFGFRLLEAGHEIRFVPDAVVNHVRGRTPSERRRIDWGYGRGQGAYYAKHARLGDSYMWRRFLINVAERLRKPHREAAYLAGLLVGAAGWTIRYRRPGA